MIFLFIEYIRTFLPVSAKILRLQQHMTLLLLNKIIVEFRSQLLQYFNPNISTLTSTSCHKQKNKFYLSAYRKHFPSSETFLNKSTLSFNSTGCVLVYHNNLTFCSHYSLILNSLKSTINQRPSGIKSCVSAQCSHHLQTRSIPLHHRTEVVDLPGLLFDQSGQCYIFLRKNNIQIFKI